MIGKEWYTARSIRTQDRVKTLQGRTIIILTPLNPLCSENGVVFDAIIDNLKVEFGGRCPAWKGQSN
jgi:hypothetical protein